MRLIRTATTIALAASLLGSCTPVISERSVLLGPERVRLRDGMDRVNRTLEQVQQDTVQPSPYDVRWSSFANGTPGMALRAGDVLHILRFSPTTRPPEFYGWHSTGPQSFGTRIPLRKIGDRGFLHPHEEEFLATILTVNRSATYLTLDGAQREALAAVLETKRVDLWNNLITALSVKRAQRDVGAPPGIGHVLTVDMDKLLAGVSAPLPGDIALAKIFRKGEVEFLSIDDPSTSVWEAVAGLRSVKGSKEGGYWPDGMSVPSVEDFAKKWNGRMTRTGGPPPPSREELRRIVDSIEPYPGTVDALVDSWARRYTLSTADRDELRADLIGGVARHRMPSFTTFNYVVVEPSGVDVNRPQWPESAWTLREWEDAGICRADDGTSLTEIRELRFRGSRFSFLIIHPGLPESVDPNQKLTPIGRKGEPNVRTHYVELKKTPDGVRRSLVNLCSACYYTGTLDHAALDRLYIDDLAFIRWGIRPEKSSPNAKVVASPNMTFR